MSIFAQKDSTTISEWNLNTEVGGVVKNGDYVPHYMVANQHGVLAPTDNAGFIRASTLYRYSPKNWGIDLGADVIVYGAKSTPYYKNNIHLQQLYADIHWKKLQLEIGMKEGKPQLVNPELSSGNMVWSENSRPIPMVKIGTNDYVSIPGTKQWVNFCFDIAYGKTIDASYNKTMYDSFMEYYNGQQPYHFACCVEGTAIHRKNFFLRTNPNAPVIFTIGGEHVAQFGGKTNGIEHKASVKNAINSLFFKNPKGGENNAQIASLDIRADLNMKTWTLGAYTQLFIDYINSSDFKKANGMDGLWGIEYKSKKRQPVSSIVFEYLQATNQEGPVYAFEDYKYGQLNKKYSMSNYYNDQLWGAWSHYGMANGSPLLMAPIYNKDSAPLFSSTLVRAFHLALQGSITNSIDYTFKTSLTDSWGEPFAYFSEKRSNWSMLAEARYNYKKYTFKLSASLDAGKLYGNNQGIMFTVKRSDILFKK